jgi:hypothetical protein
MMKSFSNSQKMTRAFETHKLTQYIITPKITTTDPKLKKIDVEL